MYLSKAPKKTDKKSSHQRKPSDSPAQQWLFLYEEMGSSNFKLGSKTTAEMRAMDYSFEVILKLLHLDYSNPTAYKFWIISNSMSTAVPLLNNPSVFVTYELYCKNDPVVTIIVRPAGDPTPNSSQAPSAPNSLRERRKASGQKNLQNVFIRPIRPSETKQLDVVSRDPISDLLEEEKIVLDLGRGRMEVFSISYLLEWIPRELARGVDIENIVVTSLTPRFRPVEVTLTRDIWTKSLLRGSSRLPFLEIWSITNEQKILRMDYLSSLFNDHPYVYNNAKLLIQDLFSFLQDEPKKRLDMLVGPYFIGKPYFSDAASRGILAIPFESDTLKGAIERLLRTKSERAQGELCSSHEFAPILLRVFGFKKDEVMGKIDLKKIRDPPKKGVREDSTMKTLKHKFSMFTLKDK